MYLKISISAVNISETMKFAWIKKIGFAIINNISIRIGQSTIDTHYSKWLDIWHSLTRNIKHDVGYNKMLGDIPELTKYNNKSKKKFDLFIPLRFWFNKFTGLALPIISTFYDDIYVIMIIL
jgi:hypothetical protein